MDLRTHTLRHLAAGQGLHEHDMSALKRIKPKGLRQDVPKARRVLIVYDKAGIDFDYWQRCRQECAVYFLSRGKENMASSGSGHSLGQVGPAQPRRAGGLAGPLAEGHGLRLICIWIRCRARPMSF